MKAFCRHYSCFYKEITAFWTAECNAEEATASSCAQRTGGLSHQTWLSPNCVLSQSESRKWGNEGGLFVWFTVLLFQHSRWLIASVQTVAAQSLSHLGLHCLRCPFWGCLTYLLQQVVNLETQWLDLLVPSWQSFTSWKPKQNTKQIKVSLRNSLAFSTATFYSATALTYLAEEAFLAATSCSFLYSKATMILAVRYKPNSCIAK